MSAHRSAASPEPRSSALSSPPLRREKTPAGSSTESSRSPRRRDSSNSSAHVTRVRTSTESPAPPAFRRTFKRGPQGSYERQTDEGPSRHRPRRIRIQRGPRNPPREAREWGSQQGTAQIRPTRRLTGVLHLGAP